MTPAPSQPAASPTAADPNAAVSTFVQQRLQSLDVYRGLIMIALAFSGFGLAATAARHLEAHPDSAVWNEVKYQFSHVEWVGCAFWDLIQPSFMFMVGVSLPYSYGVRRERGDSWRRMFFHAARRSLVLILLGVFLRSNSPTYTMTNWTFMDVVSQIGLGYIFLFLLWSCRPRWQALGAALILVGAWAMYFFYPQAGLDITRGAPEVGVTAEWAQEHLQGVAPPWHKNANVGQAIDLWFLNLFPRPKPFEFDAGGYQTINFVPELATMIFGLLCGELLRSAVPPWRKLGILILAGAAAMALGQVLHITGAVPLVKRIWTPSWALFSTGWCMLILAALYGVIDVLRWRFWTFPFVVVGMNSIAMYCLGGLLGGWTGRTLATHLGAEWFDLFGKPWAPTVERTAIGLVFWLVCWWMYRRRVFLRV